MKVIANTTIISNFAAVGRLDILRDLLGQLFITTEVYAEIQDGLAEGYEFYAGIELHMSLFIPDGWLHLTSLQDDEEFRIFSTMPAALHRGEASCLAVAVRREMAFLTDDARARAVAHGLHVLVSGTLGVLVSAVKEKLLTLETADSLLNQMIQAGYRSPHGTLVELLSD